MLTGTSPASLFRFLLLVPDWNASALQTAVVRSGHCLKASSCNVQACFHPFWPAQKTIPGETSACLLHFGEDPVTSVIFPTECIRAATRMLRRLSLPRSGAWSPLINNLQPNQWTLKYMPRLRTRCKALCLPLFVFVSSLPASILLLHAIRSLSFRLLVSGVDMVRVSNSGRSSLRYKRKHASVIADQHSAGHSTAVCFKEVLRCTWNLNEQAKCNALVAITSKPCQMPRYQLYHC